MSNLRNKKNMAIQMSGLTKILPIIESNDNFSYFFSKDALIVYYNGYTMLKIKTRSITLGKDLKKVMEEKGIDTKFNVCNYEECKKNITIYKEIMDGFKSSSAKVRERRKQHKIANRFKINNPNTPYIIADCEFGTSKEYTGKNCNFDYIILKLENSTIKEVYVTEYKCTKSFSGKSGIAVHAEDFVKLNNNTKFMEALKQGILHTFSNLSTMYNLPCNVNDCFDIKFAFLFTDLMDEKNKKSLNTQLKKVLEISTQSKLPLYIWEFDNDGFSDFSEPKLLTKEN